MRTSQMRRYCCLNCSRSSGFSSQSPLISGVPIAGDVGAGRPCRFDLGPGQVVVGDTPRIGRFDQQQIAGRDLVLQKTAETGHVALAVFVQREVVDRAVGRCRHQQQRNGGRHPALIAGDHAQPAGQQQQHGPADDGHLARGHVGRQDEVDQQQHADRRDHHQRRQPAIVSDGRARAQRPASAQQHERAEDQIDPPDPADVDAQAQAEGIEQVRQKDLEAHRGEVLAAGLHDNEEPVGQDPNRRPGQQDQPGDYQGQGPVALGQPEIEDQHVDGQQKDGVEMGCQEHEFGEHETRRTIPSEDCDYRRWSRWHAAADRC